MLYLAKMHGFLDVSNAENSYLPYSRARFYRHTRAKRKVPVYTVFRYNRTKSMVQIIDSVLKISALKTGLPI